MPYNGTYRSKFNFKGEISMLLKDHKDYQMIKRFDENGMKIFFVVGVILTICSGAYACYLYCKDKITRAQFWTICLVSALHEIFDCVYYSSRQELEDITLLKDAIVPESFKFNEEE